ncbi:Kinase, NEK [Giardia lamblia P15]|uniref:Kinase, NEK n=1 Tax=Giardia intestinalis (strain P15) TaxID=658858 RepID=E1EYY1_GIAIA|nr:Kinase, NEK [Giardia lamblia P15]
MRDAWAHLYNDMHTVSQKRRWTSYYAYRADSTRKVILKRIDLSNLETRGSNTLAWAYSQLKGLSNSYVVRCSVAHYTPGDSLLLESSFEEGCNLIDYIRHNCASCEPVSEETLWPILFQISVGLAYLHTPAGKGVILHRNLTPANVLVVANGAVKISDIWLGPLFSDDEPIMFRAPELQSSSNFSAKADVYSMGRIIAEFCTRGPSSVKAITRSVLESHGYTSAFATLLLACLDPDSGKRPMAWNVAEQSAVIRELRATKFYAHITASSSEETQIELPSMFTDSKTSLMLAAERGSLVGVQTLLYEAGVVWSGPRELPGTEVITATATSLSLLNGHKDCFKLLAKLEVGLAGVTPLMLYATGIVDLPSNPITLEATVAAYCGATCMGITALMIASMCNIPALFSLLRKELLLLDSYGRSALVYLRDAEKDTCAALLHIADEDGAQVHPLSKELILDEELNTELVSTSDDLWGQDHFGWCPLLYAISFNCVCGMRCILSHTKEPPPNSILETALHIVLASQNSDEVLSELVAYLDKYRITLRARRRYGDVTLIKTELMHAAAKGNKTEVRKYIHQLGKNVANLEGGTALICAASGGHVECCQLLYRELGMKDRHGRTALDHAKEGGHSDCMWVLRHEFSLLKNESQ